MKALSFVVAITAVVGGCGSPEGGVPLAQGFDGQFLQVDVISVSAAN